MVDLLIRNGTIVDGTGGARRPGAVGIDGGRIALVGGTGEGVEAARQIDAAGKLVLPGFIDIHSHSDFVLPAPDHEEVLACFLRQGITTLVTGNCGFAPAPVAEAHQAALRSYTSFLRPEHDLDGWRTFGDYLAALDQNGVALNVVPLAAHGAVRIAVMGMEERAPTADDLRQMAYWMDEALDAGAFGLSAGLGYAPGVFTRTDEIVQLARRVRGRDGLFTCHSRGLSETLVQAVEEVIDVGRQAGIRAQFSHLCALGQHNWPLIPEAIERLERARADGVDVATDAQAYIAGNTTISALLPPWALDGGFDALVERLEDPPTRARIRQDVEHGRPTWPTTPGGWTDNMIESLGYDNIWLLTLVQEANRPFEGKSLADVAQARGVDPFDATMDLIVSEQGRSMMLVVGSAGNFESDAPLRSILRLPYTALETDAIVTGKGKPNRGAYGAFPRMLGHFVRDERLMPLEQAVHQMTGLAADRLGTASLGRIERGAAADLVIVDPDTVADRTTYFETSVDPAGIEYVLVNGLPVVEAGQYRPGRHGRVYRHTAH